MEEAATFKGGGFFGRGVGYQRGATWPYVKLTIEKNGITITRMPNTILAKSMFFKKNAIAAINVKAGLITRPRIEITSHEKAEFPLQKNAVFFSISGKKLNQAFADYGYMINDPSHILDAWSFYCCRSLLLFPILPFLMIVIITSWH